MRHMHGTGRLGRTLRGVAGCAALWIGAVGVALAPMSAMAQSGSTAKVEGEGTDQLVFKNGNVLKGTIVAETDRTIRFKSVVSGIPLEVEYQRSDIADVKRGAKSPEAPKNDSPKESSPASPATSTSIASAASPSETTSAEPTSDQVKYYYAKLHGQLGGDVSLKSLQLLMDDAKKQKADVIIFDVDVEFKSRAQLAFGSDARQYEDDALGGFNAAEPMLKYLVEEVPPEWGGTPPRYTFVVRNARAGAAFLPIISSDVYFYPDGRLGGIGNLTEGFGGGSKRVIEKWIASILNQMIGWAKIGEWPQPDLLIRALTRVEYVMSVRFKDGKPEFFEGRPNDPTEELLTDSGEGAEADTLEAIARFQGNDVLMLNATNALRLGISKGTVESESDLIEKMGLARTGVPVGARADKILKDWNRRWEDAADKIARTWRDFQDIRQEAPDTYETRTKFRGQRIQFLNSLKSLLKRFENGIPPVVLYRAGIPIGEDGNPNYRAIDELIDEIKLQQQLDRK
jgi:hypothetical protein